MWGVATMSSKSRNAYGKIAIQAHREKHTQVPEDRWLKRSTGWNGGCLGYQFIKGSIMKTPRCTDRWSERDKEKTSDWSNRCVTDAEVWLSTVGSVNWLSLQQKPTWMLSRTLLCPRVLLISSSVTPLETCLFWLKTSIFSLFISCFYLQQLRLPLHLIMFQNMHGSIHQWAKHPVDRHSDGHKHA